MFGQIDSFYPTPEDLAFKMLSKVKNLSSIKYVLEPSCGKGNLIDSYCKYYKEHNGRRMEYKKTARDYVKFDVIEIDQYLNSILKGNGYNVVGEDFLEFQPQRYYSLILMNPPFIQGAEHLLKAIDIQERIGGQIVCIINAETLKNTYSNNRKILKDILESYNADIEYIDNAFSNSERETDVQIALVYLDIPMKDKTTMFEREFTRDNPNISFKDLNALIPNMSKLEQLVFECDLIKKSVTELYKEKFKIDHMLNSVGLNSDISICDKTYSPKILSLNEFINQINLKYWNKFINETDFLDRLPSNLRHTFNSNMERQADICFNLENVHYFYEELIAAIPQSYEEVCSKVFDDITRRYSYTDSVWNKTILHYDGWKTNDCMKITERCIIPCYRSWGLYQLPDILLDLNIIFNNITGIRDDISKDRELLKAIENHGKKLETKHFIIDSYKKQTLHIFFKNKDALQTFNILASKGKNWLPPSFGEKTWGDMDEEEKASITNFGIDVNSYALYSGKTDYLRLMA